MKSHIVLENEQGNAIIGVVIIIFSIFSAIGILSSSTMQQILVLRKDIALTHAMAIADAGTNHAFSVLADDPSLADSASPILIEDFGEGTYEVKVQRISDAVVLVVSEGFYAGHSRTSAATLQMESEYEPAETIPAPFGPVMILAGQTLTMSGGANIDIGTFTAHSNGAVVLSGGPYYYGAALTASGGITMSGNPQLILDGGIGRLHANGPIILRGTTLSSEITSHVSINGNWGTSVQAKNIAPVVTWPAWFSPLPPIEERAVDQMADIPMPELDIEAFQIFAEANGWYYAEDVNITRSWLTEDILRRTGVNVNNSETLVEPQGGVLFVEGNVQVASDMHIRGVIMAREDIIISGAAKMDNPTDYPVLVSENGDIQITGGSSLPQVNGWVYAMNGSIHATGGASGAGLVAAQNITITAGFDVGLFEAKPFVTPGASGGSGGGGGGGGEQSVKLLSWLK